MYCLVQYSREPIRSLTALSPPITAAAAAIGLVRLITLNARPRRQLGFGFGGLNSVERRLLLLLPLPLKIDEVVLQRERERVERK